EDENRPFGSSKKTPKAAPRRFASFRSWNYVKLSDRSLLRSRVLFMRIGSLYKSSVPQERILGVWEAREGLAFLDRTRTDTEVWRRTEPPGLYHVYIHT